MGYTRFKRIKFFTGFKTSAEDWNDAEEYHNEKRKLHNCFLHKTGVVPNFLEELKVTATTDGRHVSVGSGCAIDPQGNELLLPETEERISLEECDAGQEVFIVLRRNENPIQLQEDVNPEYEQYKFYEEHPIVSVVCFDAKSVEPSVDDGVVLARFRIGTSGTVRDTDIDTTDVQFAGPLVTEQRSFQPCASGTVSNLKPNGEAIEDIEEVALGVPPLYVVKAAPEEPGVVTWQIGSRKSKDDRVFYCVHFTLLSSTSDENTVSYQIYKRV